MIKGIGCDIVKISRIERLLKQTGFAQKVYTPYEQQVMAGHSAQTAAGLWAAKEAVSKAMGTGFSGFTARDIEIGHQETGQPYVILHNGAERTAAAHHIQRIHISISHDQEQAIAFAVAE